ncbi:RNA recognition motif-containing protein [Tilletia horrida]|nr:RNA recognition motif-containing protein [Tilletia horrida]
MAGDSKGKKTTATAGAHAAAAPAAAPKKDDAAASAGVDANAAGTTLFVSRLPFEATSTDLETFFSSVGPLRRAFVVTDPTTRFSKGVGYVTFALAEDANQAIKTLQGAKLQGGAKKAKAIRIEVAKQRESLKDRKRKRNEPAQAPESAAQQKRTKTTVASSTQDVEDEEENGLDAGEGSAGSDVDEDNEEEEGGDSEEEEDVEDGDEDDDKSDDDEDDDSDDNDEDEDDEEDEDAAPTQRPALPTPSEGTTLFVRNLSYTTAEADFRSLFAKFGALRYAKITMDKATGRSRGTGFVCFWNKDDADRVLDAAQRVQGAAGTGANAIATRADAKPNPFSLSAPSSLLPQGVHSVLTADPSAPLASTLTLHGRLLSIVPAVERTTAEKLGSAALRERQKADKRNTYLMREGVPLPNASLQGTCLPSISDKDKERRLDEFGRRKGQLERNPSLFISKTRLSVRQLPLFVTSKTLKRLAIHAVRFFKKEVKEGARPDLDEDERADGTISAALLSAQTAEDGGPSRKARKQAERPTAVIQAKVVRQTDRIDPLTGEGRSRGYGFLELRSFQDALRVLRWANARKEAGDLMRDWWCEELERSVEALKKAGKGSGSSSSSKKAGSDLSDEDRAARISRLEKKIKELKAGIVDKAERGGGTVAIEFSIENAVVTKKRRDRHTSFRAGKEASDKDGNQGDKKFGRPGRGRDERDSHRGERADRRDRFAPQKPVRRDNWNKKTRMGSSDEKNGAGVGAAQGSPSKRRAPQDVANRKANEGMKGKEKSGKLTGAIIGKKRKERREKKKSG